MQDPSPQLLLFAGFILAVVVSHISFPVIIYIAHIKKLMDMPGERSVHKHKVPTLGGVGIFLGVSLVLTFIGAAMQTNHILPVLGAIIVLFFIGIKDDILVLSAKKKFLAQLFVAAFVIMVSDMRINSFSGILGIQQLPYLLSVGFTVFVYILIINAYNLIDGIDGLAGGVGMISTLAFGLFFIISGHYGYALVSVALFGALVPFLVYNFSNRRKIFMGDTGSMIVGFLLSFQAISFIHLNQVHPDSLFFDKAPVMAVAILFFPLVDTLRIFFVRIVMLKQSPFTADKNHIHHRLLELGLNHKQATLLIGLSSIGLIVIAAGLATYEHHLYLAMVLALGLLLFSIPFLMSRSKHALQGMKKISNLFF
ncbi:MAG: hypothetical protein BM564_10745 [Bacteroidetes bacterium MedPE-SWsnd-G2]|nr:MAG: hypothetical protein BM564_10745 [Bacteroidetes bacterium MedPE-SWsnd-G2]